MFPLGLLVKRKLENIEPSYISNSRYFNEDLKNSTDYRTSKYEEFIEVKDNLRDLGIIMSDKGTFYEHIKHVCEKVNQQSSWILRTFHSRDVNLM